MKVRIWINCLIFLCDDFLYDSQSFTLRSWKIPCKILKHFVKSTIHTVCIIRPLLTYVSNTAWTMDDDILRNVTSGHFMLVMSCSYEKNEIL